VEDYYVEEEEEEEDYSAAEPSRAERDRDYVQLHRYSPRNAT